MKIYKMLLPNQSSVKNKAQNDIANKNRLIFNNNIASFTKFQTA